MPLATARRIDPGLASIPWPRIRLVVFDVDGTLYDQPRLRRRMWLALSAHCVRRPADVGLVRTLKVFRRVREELAEEESEDIGRLQYERPAALLGSSPEAVRAAVQIWMHERPLPFLRRCRYPGVERVFAALKASGRTIAIWSDYPAEAKLAMLGLEADLHVAATDREVQCLKPHPRGLQRTLERAGVSPEAGLFIGDRDERDGECARRLGVRYLLKTRRRVDRPHVFQRYDDLLPWLGDPASEHFSGSVPDLRLEGAGGRG